MTIFFFPILLVWLILFGFENRKNVKRAIIGFLLSIGLSAFFLFPAYFEKNLIQSESLTRFELDYHANFVAIRQLFERSWGYGSSVLGLEDKLSFQLGWPHILVLFLAPVIIIFLFLKNRYRLLLFKLLALSFLLLAFSLFMTHNQSTYIWDKIRILKYAQFPWRFLALTVFLSSVLAGLIVSFFKWSKYLAGIIIFLTIFLNWSYFRPERFIKVNDNQMLSGSLWEKQKSGAILDYLPKTALEPKESAPSLPIVRRGQAKVFDFKNKSNKWEFVVKVSEKAYLEVPVFDFPGWLVLVDNIKYSHDNQNIIGRIGVELAKGEYKVRGVFRSTPIRTFSNLITAVSFMFFMFYAKSKKFLS